MLRAKLYCIELDTRGARDCNEQNCDNCPYNYEQGNMGEQKQALDMAIKALEQEPCEDLLNGTQALPSVTPVQKTGKWLNKNTNGYYFYGKCSKCGQEFCVDAWYTQHMKYCPNCGAEMR